MSRPPRRVNLTIYQGATFRMSRRWLVGATKDTAMPVDFTGATARAQIRLEHDSAGVLWEFSTADGSITLGPDGWIGFEIDFPDTEGFRDWSEGVWDFEILFPDGEKRRLFEGRARVSPEVTR